MTLGYSLLHSTLVLALVLIKKLGNDPSFHHPDELTVIIC